MPVATNNQAILDRLGEKDPQKAQSDKTGQRN
jgi:hypothetical protein